jgi:hypothetical protein
MKYSIANWQAAVMVAVVYISQMQSTNNRYTSFVKRLRATVVVNECSIQT